MTASDASARLVTALVHTREALQQAALPLELPGVEGARAARAEMIDQLEDYVLPRLIQIDAPLLTVVGGSTGAGKSTLVNSLVGDRVSEPGVLRPTTRSPVLVHNPADAAWFDEARILPDLERTSRVSADPGALQLVASDQVPQGLAILDAPDIDSVEEQNRTLAAQLLAAADLWLFVTSAARYADQVPWDFLKQAADRSAAVAIVLDRTPPGAVEEVAGHLARMLTARGLRDSPLFTVAEGHTDDRGLLPGDSVVEIRRWGRPATIAEPKEHTEVGRFDMERAARLSGARFGYLIGDTALLALAVYRFALDTAAKHGHVPMLPPVLVREEAMYGTGFFPTERSNIYAVDGDDLYLTGTSEVALAGLHMGEVLEELPARYTAFSTNFRREAGAAGKDTRGMFRVHQFNKVEMFVYCDPSTSGDEHERLLAIEEQILQGLELPYRVVNVAAGDLGAPAAKKYDCEGWFAAQGRYRELTSTSNTTDFQARRLGIRHRVDGKNLEPVHTLNGTAVTDRAVLAILENFQGGVPDVLRQYGAPAAVGRD